MTKFDPNKHKETKKRIAELGTAKEVPWQLGKPKNHEFYQAYGKSLDDLNEVNISVQNNAGGNPKEWLIQGKTPEEEDRIIEFLNPKFIKCAIVVPLISSGNGRKFIYLAKQPGPTKKEPHKAHLRVRECILKLQKDWHKFYWDDDEKDFALEKPESKDSLGVPKWPDAKIINEGISAAFDDLIIDTTEHEVVKRARGLIR